MKRLLLLSLLGSFSMCLFANQLYIMHDNNCMDRLNYKIKYFSGSKIDLSTNSLSFKVRGNMNEHVILNVGEENDELSKTSPKISSCDDVVFNEEFVKKINSFSTQVFIVQPVGKKFRITPVQTADYFYSSEEEIAYGDTDFGFNYNYIINDQKTNLISYGMKSKVNFNFRDDKSCPSEYHFKKLSKNKSDHNLGIVIVPDLGLVKKNFVNKKTQKLEKQYVLSAINKVELLTFMDVMCNGDEEEIIEVVDAEKTMSDDDVVKINPVAKKARKAGVKMDAVEEKEVTVVALEEKTTEPTKRAGGFQVMGTDESVFEEEEEIDIDKMAETIDMEKSSSDGEIVMIAVKKAENCSHIYKDIDKGLYMDRNTGKVAEGTCGGFTYFNGIMQDNEEGTLADMPKTTEKEEVVIEDTKTEMAHAQKVIVKESEPKIIYKEPKIIYKEADPIVITKSQAEFELDCGAIPDSDHHLVKSGETLYRISKLYGISIENLKTWNQLGTSNNIQTCAMLRVKKPMFDANIPSTDLVSKGLQSTSAVASHHFVAKGETLYSIGKKYGLSVQQLKEFNGLIENTIKPGWRLKLKPEQRTVAPATSSIVSPPPAEKITPEGKPANAGGQSILQNETLILDKTISKGGEVTAEQPVEQLPAETIKKANTIISDTPYTMHTVLEAETIDSIAKKYNTTADAIRKANNMEEGEVLIPFQKIKIK